MTNSQNETIIVESKFKERITSGDVEKFYRDVEELSNAQRVVGAVFVSIKSRSIPTKGSLALEVRGHVPIIFIGFEDEAELDTMLHRYIGIFINATDIVKTDSDSSQLQANELIARLMPSFALVKRNKTRIEKIKSDHLGAINKLVLELEHDNLEILSLLEKVVKPCNDVPLTKRRRANAHDKK